MSPELVERFEKEFELWWDRSLARLPDWYQAPLLKLFVDLGDLNDYHARDRRSTWVYLKFHFWALGPDRVSVYATPNRAAKVWTAEQALRLVQILDAFQQETTSRCSICGKGPMTIYKDMLGDTADQYLCIEHGKEMIERSKQKLPD